MDSQNQASKKRPRVFLALGHTQPPAEIVINAVPLTIEKTIKHDSWAATALYRSRDGKRKVVCKFNRMQSIFGFPMRWLGRMLARRESKMYERLSDLPNIAEGFKEIHVDGKIARHATAHEFIDGHPLRWYDNVNDTFFLKLESTLRELHRRSIAYVDMNKSENVIVDQNGDPCLIDFQISVRMPGVWPCSWVLRILQRSDLYHCDKLKYRYRPDQIEKSGVKKPWWIRMHRRIANPFRAMRRGLLVRLGIRKGKGKPQTEAFIEEGLRKSENSANETQFPILQLYELLTSPEYFQACGSDNEAYSEQIFQDLVGPPLNQTDRDLIRHLKTAPTFCKAIDALRYQRVFVESHCWDSAWIAAKRDQLRLKIDAGQPTIATTAA